MKSALLRLAAAAAIVACFLGGPRAVHAQEMTHFIVPAQSLADSLRYVGAQAHVSLVFDPVLVEGRQAPAIDVRTTLDAVLSKLLSGTDIQHQFVNERTVVLTAPRAGQSSAAVAPPSPAAAHTSNPGEAVGSAGEPVAAGATSDRDIAPVSQERNLEEVIVTAQKRAERLVDTPQAVSVLSADDIAKLGAVQFRDFANSVPGLSYTTSGVGRSQIILRGVTTGTDVGSTVAVYVDDVPYGSSSAFAGGANYALDVGLFDLDRIEVLRGPQGTLYGASAMGGLIKYVSKAPDVTQFSGSARAGVSGTHDGGVSYNAATAVNMPLVQDTLALRMNGFYSRDGGYIDNISLGQSDVNRSKVYGGRVDLLLKATDNFTIRLTGFLQDISRDGSAAADFTYKGTPVGGDLDERRLLPEPFEQHFRVGSLTASYDFGPVALSSISSYQTTHLENQLDLSALDVPLLNSLRLGPFGAVGIPITASTNKFTQELRLASETTELFEYLVGGFYTHEVSAQGQSYVLEDLAGQPAPNNLFTYKAPTTYAEYAAFGDLTYHITQALDISGGVRYSKNRQAYTQVGSGLFALNTPTQHSSEGVVTYLGNARYHIDDHSTAYLRYATGYRPGGPNFVTVDPVTGALPASRTFKADRLSSYEVGYKTDTVGRALGVDVAAYYIDWKDIQIVTFRDGFGVIANAAGASVRGVEMTLSARPVNRLTATASLAYQDAHLTAEAPDLSGHNGERLPNVPRFTATLNADYKIATNTWEPSVGVTVRYVSSREASFDNNLQLLQYRLPGYTTVDARGSFALGRADVQLYAHNIFDERGQISAATAYSSFGGPAQISIQQPRTIGFMVSTRF